MTRINYWTEQEDQVLLDHYMTLGVLGILAAGLLPGRTGSAIAYRASRLRANRRGTYRPWTEAERRRLAEYYPDVPTVALMRVLGRSRPAIQQQALKLGVSKSQRYLHDSSGRFIAGAEPWNKGKPYPARGRAHETQFKVGSRPHNHVPVGTERINSDGYRQRKMTDTGYPPRDWVPVHRLLWQEHHGPIPPGHALIFRNGDKADIRLENLELVSRRELMQRNTVHRLPKELKRTIRAKAVLTRVINQRSTSP